MLIALLADRMMRCLPADTQAQFRMFLNDLVFPTTEWILCELILFDYLHVDLSSVVTPADNNLLTLVLQ
jgi:hypothetical protein